MLLTQPPTALSALTICLCTKLQHIAHSSRAPQIASNSRTGVFCADSLCNPNVAEVAELAQTMLHDSPVDEWLCAECMAMAV